MSFTAEMSKGQNQICPLSNKIKDLLPKGNSSEEASTLMRGKSDQGEEGKYRISVA